MRPRKIFTSYSHKDERLKGELDQHLTPLLLQGRVEVWNDRHIRAGAPLYEAINDNIRSADIILMLISADYVSSRSCQEEMAVALERSAAGSALAIPILIRACDWTNLPIGQLLSANTDAMPINSAPDRDVAWYDVIRSIKLILNDWDVESASTTAQPSGGDTEVSDAVSDENAIRPASDGRPAEQWVYRKEAIEEEWQALKVIIEQTLATLAERDVELGISLDIRRWGDKTIVDYRLPKLRNPRRLLIADIGGYTGYPGYQLEVYPRDAGARLPTERVRWMATDTAERLLKRLEPKPDLQFTPAAYAEHLWAAIKALA
ncbi:toll/interleukin-1 receptor domain-containing protein [Sphingomonas sanguinis]|uniref:Toll/interleukin-1 receptor domain-containing protein n=1 Tax=Sphingomonas sanguinis TaxID=33051 RepID=A0ABU5LV76_9SPHN|nr:toll/interleukin-1 receptor domain-containing protein [Sphingomonas sanguinis]MDZ7283830.1 toll/interleukin-1 receptor domain-containing protein [Sphingomonas sanguinis]